MNPANRRRPRWLIVALPLAALLLLSAATLVLAQETSLLGGKLRTGTEVTVPADETVDGNLYIFAGTTTVDGTIQGDLTAFGGTIQVNGTVDGDVLAAGGTLTVAGQVGGDVRIAGGTLTSGDTVVGDVMAAGGQVRIDSGGTVGGDLIVSGGLVSVDGTVEGSIEGNAGTYSRTGTVGGTEHVVIRTWPEWIPQTPEVVSNDVVDAVRHFVIVLLLGALLLWLLPRGLRAAETEVRERPLASVGSGLLTLVGYLVFVIAVVLLAILLAILFGLVQLGALVAIDLISAFLALTGGTFLFVLAIAYLADIVVALALGRLVMSGRTLTVWQELGVLAVGLAVVVILTSLPVIGGIAKLVVVIVGLGAIAVAAWTRWRGRRVPPPPPSVQPVTPAPPAPPVEPMTG
jgi:hypothetical protein